MLSNNFSAFMFMSYKKKMQILVIDITMFVVTFMILILLFICMHEFFLNVYDDLKAEYFCNCSVKAFKNNV